MCKGFPAPAPNKHSLIFSILKGESYLGLKINPEIEVKRLSKLTVDEIEEIHKEILVHVLEKDRRLEVATYEGQGKEAPDYLKKPYAIPAPSPFLSFVMQALVQGAAGYVISKIPAPAPLPICKACSSKGAT